MDKMKLFWDEVKNARSHPDLKHLREGQIFWGVLQNVDPVLGNSVSGTEIDPFHDDSKVDALVSFITNAWGA